MKPNIKRQKISNRPSEWGIHWKYPVKMVSFFLAAVLLLVGHHLLYQCLEGKPAIHQDVSPQLVS
jgi:hypothetical protein